MKIKLLDYISGEIDKRWIKIDSVKLAVYIAELYDCNNDLLKSAKKWLKNPTAENAIKSRYLADMSSINEESSVGELSTLCATWIIGDAPKWAYRVAFDIQGRWSQEIKEKVYEYLSKYNYKETANYV